LEPEQKIILDFNEARYDGRPEHRKIFFSGQKFSGILGRFSGQKY